MRNRSAGLNGGLTSGPSGNGGARWLAAALLIVVVGGTVFLLGRRPDPELVPAEILQAELGLRTRDRVHSVAVEGGSVERATPAEITVRVGDIVEFVTGDWLAHQVVFDLDAMSEAQRDFLTRTDQADSPPLLRLESRFVVHFRDAPTGRYPYRLEGNTSPGSGVVVVVDNP